MQGKFVRRLSEKNIISEEEKEIYAFGLHQLKGYLIGLLTDIFIGIMFGMLWECLLFTFMYIPLRQYAGGYHAPTPKICYALSVLLVCIALILIKYVELNAGILILVILISFTIILIKSPVESKNKKLSDKERAVFKKYAYLIGGAECFIAIVLYFTSFETSARCVLVALCLSAILLLFSDERKMKAV